MAAYLLTTKLAPKLASAHGRVINVSSVMHRGGNIGWKDLWVRHYSPLAMYAQSRLALTMHTRSLAEAGTSLTALSVHPGMFATPMLPVYGHSGRPAEEAAHILATLSSPGYPVVDGGYYDSLKPARAAALVDNARARERLEKLTTDLLRSVLDEAKETLRCPNEPTRSGGRRKRKANHGKGRRWENGGDHDACLGAPQSGTGFDDGHRVHLCPASGPTQAP